MEVDTKTKEQASLELTQLAKRLAYSEDPDSRTSAETAPDHPGTFESYEGLAYVCSPMYTVSHATYPLETTLGAGVAGEKCHFAIHGLDEPCPWCAHEMISVGEVGGGTTFSPRLNRWVYVATTPFRHSDGNYSRIGVITELDRETASDSGQRTWGMAPRDMESLLRLSPAVFFVRRAAEGWPVESVLGNVVRFGYMPEDFLSGSTTYSQVIHPDDLDRVAAEIGRYALDGTDSFVLRYRILDRDGVGHPVEEHVLAVRHQQGFITRYQTMVVPSYPEKGAALPDSGACAAWERMVEVFPEGLLVLRLEPQRRLIVDMANLDAAQLIGIPVEEMRGREFGEIWNNADRLVLSHALLDAAVSGTQSELTDCRYRVGKQERVMRVQAFRITQDLVGLAMEDRTQKRIAEEKLRKSHEEADRRLAEKAGDLSRTNWLLKREVSERKTAEDALRQSELKHRTLLETLPVGVISCNVVGDITEINPRALKILGLNAADITGSINLVRLPLMTETGASSAISKCLTTGETFEGDLFLKNRQGHDMYVRLHTTAIRATDGRVIRAQVILEDISDVREAQELLLKSERLKVAGKMTGGVAQTFSGLLLFVTGEIQTALRSADTGNLPQVKKLLQELLAGTRDAAQRLRRLQQFARARPDTGVILGTIFNLSDTVREACEKTRQWSQTQPKKLGSEIALDLDLGPDCHVAGDRMDLLEVVVNLLKNAVEALPEGGKITVKTRREDAQAILQIQDNGVGILKKDIETMFEPFWTTKEAHAGLGLAVNVGIVRRHAGRIMVRSKRGTGTVFTVNLPAVEAPADEQQVATQLGPLYFRILLIDEDDDFVRNMEQGLRSMGQTVFTAASGEEALQMFEDKEVDAVVSELTIQDMNGWELSKAIQASCVEKGIPKPPFIMLTAWARQLEERQILGHPGVNRILEKPVVCSRLLEIIREEIQEGTMLAHTLRLKFE
ncbi:MAG: ATP-binding protein [Thermodesulfobacteriota bacterium]